MPAAGTAALVGAAIGGGVALVSGGDPLKGAVLGALGGGISGAMGGGLAGNMLSGAVTNLVSGGDPMQGALTAGVSGAVSSGFSGGDSAAVDGLGTDAADSATQTLAQQTLEAQNPAAAFGRTTTGPMADSTLYGSGMSASDGTALSGAVTNPGSSIDAGSAAALGAQGGTTGPMASGGGIISKMMNLDPRTQAALIQAGGSMIGGYGKEKADRDLLERKAQLEKQKLYDYRNFIQSGSTGGGGVTLNMAPTNKPLTDMNGNPIYPNGLINRAMV